MSDNLPSSPSLSKNSSNPIQSTNSNEDGQSSLYEKYSQFFLSNREIFNQIDTTARALLWLAPGRYGDSEIAIESAYSFLGLFNLVHDLIGQTAERKRNPSNPLLVNSKASGYVKWLCVFGHIELLTEIIVKKKLGNNNKWFMILVFEFIKAWIKLKILAVSGGKMLTVHQIPSHRETLAKLKNTPQPTRKRIPTSQDQLETLRSYFQKPGDDNQKNENTYSLVRLLLEMMYILRPVFYVLSIIRNGKNSWKPWIISLILESTPILYHLKFPSASAKEKEETNRRVGLLLYYILRSPFFEFLTKHSPPFLSQSIQSLQAKPFIGPVITSLAEYLDYYRDHYFCTSCS